MKTILGWRRHYYVAGAGIFFIAVALVVGMTGCGGVVVTCDLTIGSTAGGSVTDPGEGTFSYNAGTVVNLVATPDAGHAFVSWIGDESHIADVYAANTTITMNGDYTVTANFLKTYCLTISSNYEGAIITPGKGTFSHSEGTVVNLVASAPPGVMIMFWRWTGDVSTVADVFAMNTTITMNGSYSITAEWTP